jgi:hypothetical protein
VIVQNNINKRWFRKPEQIDIRIEYPIRMLTGMEVSREDDEHQRVALGSRPAHSPIEMIQNIPSGQSSWSP